MMLRLKKKLTFYSIAFFDVKVEIGFFQAKKDSKQKKLTLQFEEKY